MWFARVFRRIKVFFKSSDKDSDSNITRLRRRKGFVSLISRRLPVVKLLLFIIGYLWMIVIPSPGFGRWTYIDENALQPGQVNTNWDWGDVHRADRYLEQLESIRDMNATREQRAKYIMTEFNELGISASTQQYTFMANTGALHGMNAYAIFSSPRASGNEAMLISASWLSRTGDGDGTLNLRGISTVLALAAFLKQYSLWAKDFVFVISDGYLDGMHAWLSAYHGSSQSNLEAEHLSLSSGVIWTALNIDYPGHSFSHLGVFFDGLNGRLPNQDLINSFERISRYTGGVPVVLYDHVDAREVGWDHPGADVLPSWIPKVLKDQDHIKTYAYQATNILRHVGYQARGRASGVHGLLHQFRIDAITLFAVPAPGPHGFHAMGRIVESTLRTTNNLLERLHASFFFYILTGTETFLKIGSFLPSAVLISVAMMFGGLREWVDARWILRETGKEGMPTWEQRRRPMLLPLATIMATHFLGLLMFSVIRTSLFIENRKTLSPGLFILVSSLPIASILAPPTPNQNTAPLSSLLKSLNLCLASTVISIATVLNFSLAASLAVLLGLPLSFASPGTFQVPKYIAYMLLGLGWMVLPGDEVNKAVWDWEVLGVWFAPFVCLVYTPLVLQAGIVCLLPSS